MTQMPSSFFNVISVRGMVKSFVTRRDVTGAGGNFLSPSVYFGMII